MESDYLSNKKNLRITTSICLSSFAIVYFASNLDKAMTLENRKQKQAKEVEALTSTSWPAVFVVFRLKLQLITDKKSRLADIFNSALSFGQNGRGWFFLSDKCKCVLWCNLQSGQSKLTFVPPLNIIYKGLDKASSTISVKGV